MSTLMRRVIDYGVRYRQPTVCIACRQMHFSWLLGNAVRTIRHKTGRWPLFTPIYRKYSSLTRISHGMLFGG